MFDDAKFSLRRSKEDFAENVQDDFGERILQDMFEPLEKEASHLQETDREAEQEIRSIKMLLRELRAIV